MKSPEEFESRLRSYLAEGARTDPPAGMESRIGRAVFGPRQGWALQVLAAAAILVLAVGLGIALRTVRQSTQGLAGGGPTASPAISDSASPVPSGKPSPPPATSASSQPNQALYPLMAPASMHMVSSTAGWAAGSSTDRILRTIDGGQHWNDVTPHGVRQGTWTTFFLDADNAWLGSSIQPGSPSGDFTVQIYRTADGGQTWKPAAIVHPDWGFPAAIDFVDPQHGWLFVRQEGTIEPQGSDLVAFYGTMDGGATWDKLSEAGVSPGQLPVECSKGEPVFLTTTTAWLPGGCTVNAAAPYFYVSRDGGRSWKAVSLSLPAGWPGTCLCSIDSLRFSDARNGMFVLSTYPSNAAPEAVIYSTSDGGQTWRPGPSVPAQAYGLYFVDSTHGWAFNPKAGNILSTSDGGRQWSIVGTLPSTMGPVDLQFLTTTTGWLMGMETTGRTIFKTVDGGATWMSQLSAER